ncbi:MAG: hypothetical protein R3350_02350 [Saprospiraceae bacterium]|nr:hypothetical protein [Saprospiraceae bacterium]
MKNMNKLSTFLLALLFMVGWSGFAYGQYDDLYYNPEKDAGKYQYDEPYASDEYYEDEYYDDEYGYDDESYNYYYTSRIKRFHRPYYGFDYYDPVYTDIAYYDPSMLWMYPGATVLIYDNFFSYGDYMRWRRFQRYNRFRSGFFPGGGINFSLGFGVGSPFFGNSPFGFYNPWWGNRWYSPGLYSYNTFYNNFYFGGGSFYCPPTWGSGYVYNTIDNYRDTYYGPRTGSVRPVEGVNSGRGRGSSSELDNRRLTERSRPMIQSPTTGRRGVDRGTINRGNTSADELEGNTYRPRTRATERQRIGDRSSIDNTRRVPQQRERTSPYIPRTRDRSTIDRSRTQDLRGRTYRPSDRTRRPSSIDRSRVPSRTRAIDRSGTRSIPSRSYRPNNNSRTRSSIDRSRGSSINRSSGVRSSSGVKRSSGTRSSSSGNNSSSGSRSNRGNNNNQ